MTKRDFSQPHRTKYHVELLDAQYKTMHEWWGIKATPLDAETTAKIKKGLEEAWRACK